MSDTCTDTNTEVAMSYLYLLVFPGRNLLKIGKADDIQQRVKTLKQVWGDVDYSESYELHAPRDTVFRVEKALQLMLFSQQTLFDEGDGKTEMFELSALCTVIDYVNIFTKHSGGALRRGISLVEPRFCHKAPKKPVRKMGKTTCQSSADWRALPRVFVLSSLFSVARAGKREMFVNEPVACYGANSMSITGEGFRQDDADVLLQLLSQADNAIAPTIHATLLALKWQIHPAAYDRLKTCVKRLQTTVIDMIIEGGFNDPIPLSGTLLNSEFKFKCLGHEGVQVEWGNGLECLFNDEFCVHTDWSVRLSLPAMGKFLYTLFSAKNGQQTHTIESLHRLSASKIVELRKFKREVKIALEILTVGGFLESASIDDKSWIVTVERKFEGDVALKKIPARYAE